jgi:glyoxylase-like metal-dependent hydrolase (beta-lactamase superfamily II)
MFLALFSCQPQLSWRRKKDMAQQIPVDSSARAIEVEHDSLHEVATDLAYQRHVLVNVIYYGAANAGNGKWVLIDAGVFGSAGRIIKAAESRFGKDARPAAIVMTHGHFDHIGALRELAELWDVPIYAHDLEHPFLNGSASYPAPDPTVGGGMMAALSPMYPRGPIDVRRWLQSLPTDGSVPHMPGWRWIYTPGHTQGHVAFWREADRALIAGDAFITTAQESAYAVMTQKLELHGPPMYYTEDWDAAKESVRDLSALQPELVITGHGRAMQGEEMRRALRELVDNFDEVAVPHGSAGIAKG